MTIVDKLNIYSEVIELSKKVFDFYREFMIAQGNEFSRKIHSSLNILHDLNSSFTEFTKINVRTLSNTSSSDGTWILFYNNKFPPHAIRIEIFNKIISILDYNDNEDKSLLSKSKLELLDFINDIINNSCKCK